MRFVFPGAAYEQRAKAFVQEFLDHGSQLNGQGELDRYLRESTYADWLAKLVSDADLANVPEGRVPGYTYFYVDDQDRIVGVINIRLYLNGFLREQGGHIGYSIRPTRRGKGYATSMLRGALDFLAPLGLRDVLVTCHKDNAASAKVIQNCGGVLEDETFSEHYGRMVQRYWIHRENAQQM